MILMGPTFLFVTHFTVLFFGLIVNLTAGKKNKGLDPCNLLLAPMVEDPCGTNEHLFQSSAVVVGHLELQLKVKL